MGIYRHFESKEALLVGLFERHCEQLQCGMVAALGAQSGWERLTTLIRFHVNQVLAEPGLIPIFQREDAGLNAADRERLHTVLRRYVSTWTEALMQYRPDLSQGMARAIVAAVFGLLNSPAYDYPHLPEDAVHELLTALAWRVIQPAPDGAAPAKTRNPANSVTSDPKTGGRPSTELAHISPAEIP